MGDGTHKTGVRGRTQESIGGADMKMREMQVVKWRDRCKHTGHRKRCRTTEWSFMRGGGCGHT